MPGCLSSTISNTILVLCYCFLLNRNGAIVCVQAAGNNNNRASFRRHVGSLASTRLPKKELTNNGNAYSTTAGGEYINSNDWGVVTSGSPISTPTAAPTYAPSSFSDASADNDEHNEWLLQQQQYQIEATTFSTESSPSPRANTRRRNGKGILPSFVSVQNMAATTRSFFTAAQAYSRRVYGESATTFSVASSSIVVFLLWNLLPPARSILNQFFLASRLSAKRTFGASLVFSAISHSSFRHLLVNLYVFLSLSPKLSSIKVPSSSWAAKTRKAYAGLSDAALWPFFLGGALAGNGMFLLFRPKGSCLGLSGVTCAMIAVYASAMPDRVLRLMVMGIIPVSLRAGTMVQILFAVSLAGSCFMPSSPISHLGHLGGLVFGLLYYQNVMIRSKQMLPMKLLFGK